MDIHITKLNKTYFSEGRRIEALFDVNLAIPANEIFTLLGPSGCGKTTLLRSIVGLEMPDEGEIQIGDEIVFSTRKGIFVPPEKRGLSMVFQSYAIWPHMNVFDNVAYPLQTQKKPKEEIRDRVKNTLEFVQLGGFENRPATKLSGGQQQRVALARALVAQPKVILFDEPLSNLDAKLREETRKELREFLTTLRITAVYVTHDRIEALSLSDTVAVMKEGRIVEIGTPKQIYFDSDRRFVADFIGRANLVEGSAARVEADRTIVNTALGDIVCSKKKDVSPGDAVVVCVRPEFIEVMEKTGGEGPNIFNGHIDSLIFVGDAYEGEIRVGDTVLIVRVEPTLDVHQGDEVALRFDPDHCSILLK
ncbi:MAG TPA: ABC transporter ATP-binding protein [Deltaproteobacteria bacterium]|nr:ABC transporter ATP-binding protein [Deltaproteobacteria bacterium]HPR51170.1 ABC transporter ATP-binding protein [Deltaproteobacteria bacterium]